MYAQMEESVNVLSLIASDFQLPHMIYYKHGSKRVDVQPALCHHTISLKIALKRCRGEYA